MTCQDCYAYLGASLLVIVEYRFGYFGFEIKGGGALGIKAAIDMLDPTISGSFTIKILEESNKYSSVYLGYAGLYLGYTFGGLTATLSGSGTFSGAASFSTARSAEGSLGLLLVSTGYPTFPASFNEKYSPPVFSAKSFKLKSFSLAVELTGTEKFYISMFNLVFFYFSSSISGSVSVAVAMATSASVSISSTPKTSLSLQNIHQSESIPSFESYIPGEIITIKFDYFGFNPSENTTIFYSIEKSNMSHPIMQRYFISSTTGSGTFVTDWIVPWDYSLAGVGPDNTQIIVKASNMIFDIYKSPSFSTSLFTEYDGIFTSPNIAEIVPTDTPYLLKWNRDLLTSFQQNYWDSDLGADVFARNVLIVLHAEKMSPNGSIILSKSSYHNLTVSAVPNIGQCTVTFPSTLNDIGDRFYLVVESLLNNDIRGWSKNYFTLAPGITNSGKLSLQNLNNVFNNLTMSKNLLTTIGEFRDGESIKAASCGGTTMTSGFKSGMASGTLDILTIEVYSTPHSTSTSVYSPGALCIELPTGSPSQRPTSAPTTASPTLTPTSAPTTYAPSSVFSAGIQALSNSSNSPNSSIIGIAVGVGGGVLLLVLIASIVYCCRRKAVPGTSGDQRNNDINDQIIIGAP